MLSVTNVVERLGEGCVAESEGGWLEGSKLKAAGVAEW